MNLDTVLKRKDAAISAMRDEHAKVMRLHLTFGYYLNAITRIRQQYAALPRWAMAEVEGYRSALYDALMHSLQWRLYDGLHWYSIGEKDHLYHFAEPGQVSSPFPVSPQPSPATFVAGDFYYPTGEAWSKAE